MSDSKRGNFIGSFIAVCLLCILTIAVWTDIRTGKISNRLIGLGLLTGYIHNLMLYSWKGSIYFLIQISIPVLIFYLLFLVRALGAGDIKLFSVICSCIGLKGFGKVAIYSFLVGSVFSFLVLLRNRNLYGRMTYLFYYIKTTLLTKSISKYDYQSDGKQNYIHFSLSVFIAYLMFLGGI